MSHQLCCGKTICLGCLHALIFATAESRERNNRSSNNTNSVAGKVICPFCRDAKNMVHYYTDEFKKRADANDPKALIAVMGLRFYQGECGWPKDLKKAFDLHLKAGDLGYHQAYSFVGDAYYHADCGVEEDDEKAEYYYELAAIAGESHARYNLGNIEQRRFNW